MYLKLIYRDRNDDNKRKFKFFKVKGSRLKTGMKIDRGCQGHIDCIAFSKQSHVDYLITTYTEEINENV